jgi:hypothetical protein
MRNTGSWQAAGPGDYAAGVGPQPGQYGADGYRGDSWQGAGGQPGHQAQPGQPGQGWAAAPGQPGPGVYSTGSWQAAGAGPYGAQNMRNTGSWQATGPTGAPPAGSTWAGAAAAPGYGQGQGQYSQQNMRNTGSWQAAGPGPYAPGASPHSGSHQGQPYAGQPYSSDPYAGQPYNGQPQNGQPQNGQPHSASGRLGDSPPGGPAAGLRNTGGFGRVGSPLIRQRDSALPDPLPNAPAGAGGRSPIAAIETDNVAAFARDLRVLRAKAGLDYPDMAEKSHYTMRTLASAAGGLRLPTLPVLIAYVNACGGDVADWEERWDRLMKAGKKSQAAVPFPDEETTAGAPGSGARGSGAPGSGAGGSSGAGGRPRIPQEARQTGEIYVITSARERDERW